MRLDYISPDWPIQDRVMTLTTLRTGGTSQGPYQGLNLALHVGDNRADVLENRAVLRQQFELKSEPKWLSQVHSRIAVNANELMPDTIEADAAYTDQKDVICGVLTADCLPIVLANQTTACVGVVHAGWKGLLDGVVQETVRSMTEIAKPEYAWLGPAIGPQAFEVGVDVYEPFVEKDREFMNAFKSIRQDKDKWYFDIYAAARQVLNSVGIAQIYGGTHCTYTEKQRFFSYRRDQATGRMATLVWIK